MVICNLGRKILEHIYGKRYFLGVKCIYRMLNNYMLWLGWNLLFFTVMWEKRGWGVMTLPRTSISFFISGKTFKTKSLLSRHYSLTSFFILISKDCFIFFNDSSPYCLIFSCLMFKLIVGILKKRFLSNTSHR